MTKRILLIGAAVLALISMLCIGLVIGVMVSPLQARIGQVIERVFNRGNRAEVQVAPEFFRRDSDGRQSSASGLRIARVAADSPAEQAGLRRGDVLLEVGGDPVNDLAGLRDLLSGYEPGDSVELLVRRGSQEMTLTATLTEAPVPSTAQTAYLGITPAGRLAQPGMDGSGSTPETDGTEAIAGARITEVVEGSPAEQAGLQAGEVIRAVDGEELGPESDLAAIIGAHQPGDTVEFTLLGPDGETREVAVELGQHSEQEGAAWLGIYYAVPLANSGQLPFMPGSPGMPGGIDPRFPERGIPFPPGSLHSGALIREVAEDSPAEEAGLQAGQIVEAIDGEELSSAKELTEIIAAHKPGDSLTLTVVEPQSGESQEVEVTLGEHPKKSGAGWLGIRFNFLNIRYNPDSLPEG